MKFSGLLVTAANFVIEIDDVLDANIASFLRCKSISLSILDFISKFSGAASTTKSQSNNSSFFRWKLVLYNIYIFFKSSILFLVISLSHQDSMNFLD